MSTAVGLSPIRSPSRPSSRSSTRSGRASPSQHPDDPVSVRNQISSLRHSIRHQQAQLHTLENVILRGPRPLPPGFELSEDISSPPSFSIPFGSPPKTSKMQRRSSFEVLQSLAGPESSLPLPKRDMMQDGIREGVPMEFGVGRADPQSGKRGSSPTRTLSRIPVSSVGNARALADEGQSFSGRPPALDLQSTNGGDTLAVPAPPPSPGKRLSMTPGGTTKVLADLQTGVINARNALENTKAQLRLSQRSVAQLTRQTEDLKDGRERLRLENEGLNNVVARKERLLQEVLERARKAETDTVTLRAQLKAETSASKKSLREMEVALSESTALSQKSEREYATLRDSIQGMVESWKADMDALRAEVTRREDAWRKEASIVGEKYKRLVEEVRAAETERGSVKSLREEDELARKEVEDGFRDDIGQMKNAIEQSSQATDEAGQTAKELANELARLRRLLRQAGRDESDPPT